MRDSWHFQGSSTEGGRWKSDQRKASPMWHLISTSEGRGGYLKPSVDTKLYLQHRLSRKFIVVFTEWTRPNSKLMGFTTIGSPECLSVSTEELKIMQIKCPVIVACERCHDYYPFPQINLGIFRFLTFAWHLTDITLKWCGIWTKEWGEWCGVWGGGLKEMRCFKGVDGCSEFTSDAFTSVGRLWAKYYRKGNFTVGQSSHKASFTRRDDNNFATADDICCQKIPLSKYATKHTFWLKGWINCIPRHWNVAYCSMTTFSEQIQI